ncbi:conserved hypothetical protein [Uncinocarpus reesii 1704]|uniref:CENP-V/GFA domain-containing protein n=1 Tax=Uncinocarpus reesii (strain UAMH 1704) TaxID=336963 RepID=C4JI89_UNCRE|nr:uncharacterized protein UREG_02835 [Uncinocarpus reesii 1704]EEP77986.1 conserved hypothetical protein [Uncinocarpus reesii 1704]
MSRETPLRGACSCGRNQYAIIIPPDSTEQAEVYFDISSEDRRIQGAPLTAWLRVPLLWYQSFTRSFFPDETHATIRRVFVPENAPHSRRVFCGFCGTPLTFWTEDPPEEADYMSVTVGSLSSDDQNILEDLDILPKEIETGDVATASTALTSTAPSALQPSAGDAQVSVSHRTGAIYGIPWFEEMIQGSRLGRVGKHRRGFGSSADRSVQIEWEVSEWHDAHGGVRTMQSPGSSQERVRTSFKRKSPEVG